MTPGARRAAVIEVLERLEAEPRPADRVLGDYLAARRYVGAKDRRAIGDLLFAILRNRAALDWWIGRAAAGGGAPSPRARLVAALVLVAGETAAGLRASFEDGPYAPAPLSDDEAALAEALTDRALRDEAQPPWVRSEAPRWLAAKFAEAFGERAEAELRALVPPAPVDLRVNALKTDRAGALAALAEDGLDAEPTPLSPWGLRLPGRRALGNARAYRQGLVEVQDEGSQAVALLVGAAPGMTVVDFCAGAGGKTLALAAAMGGSGRLVAHDADPLRLAEAERRLSRAGAGWAELWPGERPEPPGLAARCDRVLVDAPCSGTGVWRRQPDARWRLSPDGLARYRAAQAAVLDAAAPLVAPGGRLVYATCSLLPEENGAQVAAFLERRPDFAAVPPGPLWAAALDGPCPGDGEAVLLSPARSGTDGFHCAVLERRGAP